MEGEVIVITKDITKEIASSKSLRSTHRNDKLLVFYRFLAYKKQLPELS